MIGFAIIGYSLFVFVVFRYLRRNYRRYSSAALAVLSLWPFFEVFLLPWLVLQANCDLAERWVKPVPRGDSVFMMRGCDSACVEEILDGHYSEVQVTTWRAVNDTSRQVHLALRRSKIGDSECKYGWPEYFDFNTARGGECVSATQITNITARYREKIYEKNIKYSFLHLLRCGIMEVYDSINGDIIAKRSVVFVNSSVWPMQEVFRALGIHMSGACRHSVIAYNEIFK